MAHGYQSGAIESQVLQLHYDLSQGLVPKVYGFDSEMYAVIMEDLFNFRIMRYGLLDYVSYPNFAEQITDYMVRTLLLTSDVVMDHKEKKELVKRYINLNYARSLSN